MKLFQGDREGLLRSVRSDLVRCTSCDLLLGAFALTELASVIEEMSGARRIRLLIGSNAQRCDIAEIAFARGRTDIANRAVSAERFAGRSELQERVAQLQSGIRNCIASMVQCDTDQTLLRRMAELIDNGVLDVRAYVRSRIQSDLLIAQFGRDTGAATKGSGSLLIPATDDSGGLWVRVDSDDEAGEWQKISDEFDGFWTSSSPFKEQLLSDIRASWALHQPSPYLLYLSVLSRLVHDRLTDTEDAHDERWMDGLPPLADFQQVAVQQALTILRQYGGVIVADVVGLGKTYIGSAMLKILREQGQRATIFSPPTLVPMWEEFNQIYGLSAVVVSTGRLVGDGKVDLSEPAYQTADRTVVLIDESHRFRNRGTDTYRALSQYCQGRQCVLLTATPYNLRPRDIYGQIRLFAEDELDLGLTPPRLNEFFSAIDKGTASLVDVLRPIMIRRTRKHIQKHYPDSTIGVQQPDGTTTHQPVQFPRRNAPTVVTYDLEGVYGEHIYDGIVRLISGKYEAGDSLSYARYNVSAYLRPDFAERQPYVELKQAGGAVRGFVRILLFKRLESSTEAFRASIRKMIRVNERFLEAIDAGIIPAGDQAQSVLYDQSYHDEESLLEALSDVQVRYSPEAFDTDRLSSDISSDIRTLREIDALVTPITPDKDAKIQVLRDLLRNVLARKKVLVFTQFEATARYLGENLQDVPRTAWLSGQHRSKHRSFTATIGRFAPRANPRLAKSGLEPIDVLVATDVLSEGLNLQDCATVVNYDLHWNPVRLIQRIGRVDRVGSQAEEINLYNFVPERAVERVLGLEELLRHRIAEIHSFIGEDNAILHPDEKINDQEMYAAYTQPIEEPDEDAAGLALDFTEIEELVRFLRRTDPDLMNRVKDIPAGSRTARKSSAAPATFLSMKAGTFEHIVLIDGLGRKVTTQLEDILPMLECDASEATCEVPRSHNRIVSEALRQFETEAKQRHTDQQTGPRLSAGQSYVLRRLNELIRNEQRDERKVLLRTFERLSRARLPEAAIREFNAIRRLGLHGDSLVSRLEQAYRDLDLGRYESSANDPVNESPVARILCSEALL